MITQPLSAECDDSHSGGGGANFAWTLRGHGATSGAGRREGHSRHRDPDIIVVDAEGFDRLIVSQFNFAGISTKLVIYETESMTNADAGAAMSAVAG